MNYHKIRQNPKQFLSITSLSVEKFDELLPRFQTCWEDYIHHYNLDGQPRVRPYIAPDNAFLYPNSIELGMYSSKVQSHECF